jgi:hypothetical protein
MSRHECLPHVAVDGSYVDPTTRRGPNTKLPSVLCGKCWKRVHLWLDVCRTRDDAAIRRARKRRTKR